ncbi:MAG: hypothetical protein GSR80_001041 [Desulfurococcales archaeon]|nr:hypothetical protein [Desulfurococcales archaeon]
MSGEEEKREEAKRVLFHASTGPTGGSESGESESDVRELKEILSALSEFLKGLSEPLEKLIDTILKIADGRRVGEEVAAFYSSLKGAGVPEEVAVEMTREYFHKRIAALDLAKLLERFIRREVLEEEEEEGGGGEA